MDIQKTFHSRDPLQAVNGWFCLTYTLSIWLRVKVNE